MTEQGSERGIEIYIADVRPLGDVRLYQEKQRLLPLERRERLERYQKQEDRLRGLGAGILLEYGLRERGLSLLENTPGKRMVYMEKGKYGKPYLKEPGACFFNLSHAGDYVAAVFGACEVGIDIERIRRAKTAIARRFFTEEEYAYLEGLKRENPAVNEENGTFLDRVFTGMWTGKESYIKAVGEGMHLPLADFSVLEDRIAGEKNFYLKSWEKPEGYLLSVCAGEPVETRITYVDLQKSI